MAKNKGRGKVDVQVVDGVVTAMNGDGDDPTRLWATAHALGEERDPDVARAALEKSKTGGVVRSWLSVMAGSPEPIDAQAVAELAATAKASRALLAEAMGKVANLVEADAVARAAENLSEATPFAPFVVEAGRQAAMTTGRSELASVLEARFAFLQAHGATLADLRESAQEKKQKAAFEHVKQLTGNERDQVLVWILDRGDVGRDAKRWARVESVTNPAVPVLLMAFALNDEYGIYDEEEAELGVRMAAAGAAGAERVASIIEEAASRTWVHALEHLAPGCGAAFKHPRAFAAITKGLADDEYVRGRLCEDGRHWIKALEVDQARQVADKLIELSEELDEEDASIGRAFFYFENPGGLVTFAAALAREDIKEHTRDQLYDAVENIPGVAAQNVLIDMLWKEKTNQRDLVYSINEACMPDRHADVIARLEREPSFEAAWIYGGCHVNWAHRPRFLLETLERLPEGGDQAKRAFLISKGVQAALELRRYPLAKQLLAELGSAKKGNCPADDDVDTILGDKDDKDLPKLLAKLKSGALEAEQQKLLAEVDSLRAAGVPLAADKERLGMLAGGTVDRPVHVDSRTHEVWFFDNEGPFLYYDGYGITKPPFELTKHRLVNGWDSTIESLAPFCRGWRTAGRSLQRNNEGELREVLRSDRRLVMRFYGDRVPVTTWTMFGFTFPDEAAAERAFESLANNPLDGYRMVDPFYVAGKKGGGWVREYGNRSVKASCVGTSFRSNDDEKTFGSPDEARSAYDEAEARLLEQGMLPRKIELDDTRRPADDKPLKQFLDERDRDDNQDGAWHLQGLPAMRAAVASSGLPLDDVQVTLGGPADATALAAYDAALPEPMSEQLRATWRAVASASWSIGGSGYRFLSPTEVLANRAAGRAELGVRIGVIRNKQVRATMTELVDHLDVIVTDDAGNGVVAWDIRQQEQDCFHCVGGDSLANPWSAPLNWTLACTLCSDFNKALVAKFPEIKKLKLGQPVSDLGGGGGKAKTKAPAKKAAKPAKQAAKPVKKAAKAKAPAKPAKKKAKAASSKGTKKKATKKKKR